MTSDTGSADAPSTAGSISGSQIQPAQLLSQLACQALVITLFVGAAAYLALDRPALLGIDDANITQVYAANLAAGHGYVYQPGGERVEGSTSLTWTLLNAGAFAISKHPEWLIAGLASLLCGATVFLSLKLADTLARQFNVSATVTNWVVAVAIASSPALFAWAIWTLMDVVLWSAVLLLLLNVLVAETTSKATSWCRTWVLATATAAVVATRPEGIALALVLLFGSALLKWKCENAPVSRCRPYLVAAITAVICFAALTLLRVAYFGFPFPNTFYAKVSSSPVRQIVGGLRYLFGYLGKSPNCLLYVAFWAGLGSVCTSNRFELSGAARASAGVMLIAIGAVLGVYVVMGGDHFPMYRFYQPLTPLLPIALALACAFAWPRIPPPIRQHWTSRAVLAACVCLFLAGSFVEFASRNDGMRLQFSIGIEGRRIAQRLKQLATPPSVGVLTAGGFAREYTGKTYDLMGLNWVEMAHADPIKTGNVRNHAGFSPRVFWRARPELLAFVGDRCSAARSWAPDTFELNALKGLQGTHDFLAEYTPVKVGCYLGFARKDLLARLGPQEVIKPIKSQCGG